MTSALDDMPIAISILSPEKFTAREQYATTVHETIVGLARWLSWPLVTASKSESGAFSFATFRNGRRRNEDVLAVSALGLDVDDTTVRLDDALELVSPWLAIGYSTFQHTAEAPRYRIVLPYARPVTADEHRAIWRHIAGHLAPTGIVIDPATKDPARLLFVPCVPEGSAFESAVVRGEPLDVDAVLSAARADDARDEARRRANAARQSAATTPTIERVRRYVARMDPAVSGQGGHVATFRVACRIVGSVADEYAQAALLAEYNRRCEPPWSERELRHKLDGARKRGDLEPLSERKAS